MANQNQGELGNVQAGQRNLFDAAHKLMLLGAAAVVSTVACNRNRNNTDDADASRVFTAAIGFLAWLLGVCLLSVAPLLADQFPQEADRLAGAAISRAGAVLGRFFIPWN